MTTLKVLNMSSVIPNSTENTSNTLSSVQCTNKQAAYYASKKAVKEQKCRHRNVLRYRSGWLEAETQNLGYLRSTSGVRSALKQKQPALHLAEF